MGWPHNAYVGQKVVCVDPIYELVLDNIYTISKIGNIENVIGFNLIESPPDLIGEYRKGCNTEWYYWRFRPVQSTDKGMEVLRGLLNPINHKVLENA